MQAVIMAGGAGTRLRPLTKMIPKPMAPICGKPVIGHILDLLDRHGVTGAAVTVGYRAEVIEDYFKQRDNRWKSIRLRFVREHSPLGTAGGVKNALSGARDDFIVISGDAMCDLDLSAAVRFHQKHGAAATLVVTCASDPREYGLVNVDREGRIRGFLEKPGYPQAISELCNTGIYVLSPSVLDLIEEGVFSDFAADVFPRMLREGLPIYAHHSEGFWCDIGDLSAYHASAMAAIGGGVFCEPNGVRQPDGVIWEERPEKTSATVLPPCYIGKNVTLEDGCVVMGSVAESGAVIGAGARVFDSVLLPGAVVEGGETVTGSLVFPKEIAEKSIPAAFSDHLTRYVAFEEETFSNPPPDMTPELAMRVGMALSEAAGGAVAGISCACDAQSHLLADALRIGMMAGGTDVADFGQGIAGMLAFAQTKLDLPFALLVEAKSESPIRVFGEGGLPVHRVIERAAERALRSNLAAPSEKTGRTARFPDMELLYLHSLAAFAPQRLDGCSVSVLSDDPACARMLQEVVLSLGGNLSGELQLMLGGRGRTLELAQSGKSLIKDDVTLILCARAALQRGETVAVPFDAPQILDRLSGGTGGAVLRYRSCPMGGQDAAARTAALRTPWVRDGLARAVLLLAECRRQGASPWDLVHDIPRYCTKARFLPCYSSPASVLSRLGDAMETADEGVFLRGKTATALIKPNRKGNRRKILVESAREETAAELVDRIEGLLGSGSGPGA